MTSGLRRDALVDPAGPSAPGPVRCVAVLAVALLVPAVILTVAGPGSNPRAAAWPTAGLAVLAAACLVGVLALCPRQAEIGIRPVGRSWQVAYYAGLLAGLIAWSPWFMLVSWTACVYAFLLFEARWGFFGAAAGGVALTAAQAGSLVPSSPETVPLFALSVMAPLLAGGWYLGRESGARRRLIGELTDANAGLRAASGGERAAARATGRAGPAGWGAAGKAADGPRDP